MQKHKYCQSVEHKEHNVGHSSLFMYFGHIDSAGTVKPLHSSLFLQTKVYSMSYERKSYTLLQIFLLILQ